MFMAGPVYAIITPARNEAEHIQLTINSVVAQSVRPQKWVIVNDGSSDDTGKVIDAGARQHSWITAVHRADRGFRAAGGGVVEAFYNGFAQLGSEPFDFIVKLDGDLSFDPNY